MRIVAQRHAAAIAKIERVLRIEATQRVGGLFVVRFARIAVVIGIVVPGVGGKSRAAAHPRAIRRITRTDRVRRSVLDDVARDTAAVGTRQQRARPDDRTERAGKDRLGVGLVRVRVTRVQVDRNGLPDVAQVLLIRVVVVEVRAGAAARGNRPTVRIDARHDLRVDPTDVVAGFIKPRLR